jgi:hypothetical protein
MKKTIYKLNPNSDRYRICPNPECNRAHMVMHRSRDYCSDKCADDHYNMKRRHTNHAVAMMTKGGTISSIVQEQVLAGRDIYEGLLTDEEWSSGMKINLEILTGLIIDERNGTCFWIQELVNQGFHFHCFSTSGKLHNMPKNKPGQFVVYQNYRIYRTQADEILIINSNNLIPRKND